MISNSMKTTPAPCGRSCSQLNANQHSVSDTSAETKPSRRKRVSACAPARNVLSLRNRASQATQPAASRGRAYSSRRKIFRTRPTVSRLMMARSLRPRATTRSNTTGNYIAQRICSTRSRKAITGSYRTLSSNQHKPYRDAHRGKAVFWQTDSTSSKWLKLLKDGTRNLRLRAPRRLKQVRE